MAQAATEPSKEPPKAAGTSPSLTLDALSVRLGPHVLQLQSGCTLHAGRLYLLWGPSGSGKSSFARALLGLGELANPRIPCTGNVTLRDAAGGEHALWRGSAYQPAGREHIAFLPQADRLGFVDGLSTFDNLRLFSRLSQNDARVEVERLAARFHLPALPQQPARASGGERMRLSAIRGLLPRRRGEGPPALLIADEPTAGLDAMAAKALAKELIDLAKQGESVVVVITHDPQVFTGPARGDIGPTAQARMVRIFECEFAEDGAKVAREIGQLRLETGPERHGLLEALARSGSGVLQTIGGIALSPLAFLWGLFGLRRPFAAVRQILLDASGPGTHLFSLVGCLLMAGTVAYFIFEQMPKPELIEPLLLPEILEVTGHTLVRVILPLGACALVTAKLGAAQAARLSAAVRAGLLETLALARWRVESFALVPAVLAQILAMALATAAALVGGVVLAALVYVAGHERASLALALDLMISGLKQTADWEQFLLAKVLASGFLGGVIATLFGLAPATSEDDVAKAVHRTLLWSVLCVIACQCGFIVAEFARG